jgi:hypothetical protein
MSESSKRRPGWRTVAVLAAGVAIGTTIMATPAWSHFQSSVSHLKSHFDPRYANAVSGTDKARNANKVDGQEVAAFTHTTAAGNVSGNCTYLNHAVTNNNPTAHVVAMHEYTGAYLNKTLGVYYEEVIGQWCVFLEDATTMPTGQSFEIIAVDPPGAPATSARASRQAASAEAPGR